MKIHYIVILTIIICIILLLSSRDQNEDQSVENLGAGGISIRGAVYPPYPGDPYGYDYNTSYNIFYRENIRI